MEREKSLISEPLFPFFCVFFMTHFSKKCDEDAVKNLRRNVGSEFGDKIPQFHGAA